jgi:hypothetical protein
MVLHITVAVVAGLAALWAVNVPHHSFTGVLRQIIAIGVLTYLFIVVRRSRSKPPADNEHVNDVLVAPGDMLDAPSARITAYDQQGRTPVERVFDP